MRLSAREILNLPVETQIGKYLGKVCNFIIDTNTQSIIFYEVKSGLVTGLLKKKLIINSSQVISIEKNKMIVKDGFSFEEKILTKTQKVQAGAI